MLLLFFYHLAYVMVSWYLLPDCWNTVTAVIASSIDTWTLPWQWHSSSWPCQPALILPPLSLFVLTMLVSWRSCEKQGHLNYRVSIAQCRALTSLFFPKAEWVKAAIQLFYRDGLDSFIYFLWSAGYILSSSLRCFFFTSSKSLIIRLICISLYYLQVSEILRQLLKIRGVTRRGGGSMFLFGFLRDTA